MQRQMFPSKLSSTCCLLGFGLFWRQLHTYIHTYKHSSSRQTCEWVQLLGTAIYNSIHVYNYVYYNTLILAHVVKICTHAQVYTTGATALTVCNIHSLILIPCTSYPTYTHYTIHRETALPMSNVPSLHTTMAYSDTHTHQMYVCMYAHTHVK